MTTCGPARSLGSAADLFAGGTVYAPDREWAELVITEMSLFPAGRFSGFDRQFFNGFEIPAGCGIGGDGRGAV